VFEAVSPRDFAQWFRATRREVDAIGDPVAGAEYACRSLMGLIWDAQPDTASRDWTGVHELVTTATLEGLEKVRKPTAADVVWSVLRGVGLGAKLEKWTAPLRDIDRVHRVHEGGAVAGQVATLATFLHRRTTKDPTATTTNKQIEAAYLAWCRDLEEPPLSSRELGHLLGKLGGVTRLRSRAGIAYRGIVLLP
jgi:hypothetical protein